jgi:hypothetical protein
MKTRLTHREDAVIKALKLCRDVLYGYMAACGDDEEPRTHKKAREAADKALAMYEGGDDAKSR